MPRFPSDLKPDLVSYMDLQTVGRFCASSKENKELCSPSLSRFQDCRQLLSRYPIYTDGVASDIAATFGAYMQEKKPSFPIDSLLRALGSKMNANELDKFLQIARNLDSKDYKSASELITSFIANTPANMQNEFEVFLGILIDHAGENLIARMDDLVSDLFNFDQPYFVDNGSIIERRAYNANIAREYHVTLSSESRFTRARQVSGGFSPEPLDLRGLVSLMSRLEHRDAFLEAYETNGEAMFNGFFAYVSSQNRDNQAMQEIFEDVGDFFHLAKKLPKLTASSDQPAHERVLSFLDVGNGKRKRKR